VMDPNGLAHIAYLDVDHRKVKYTHWNGKNWETQLVDQLVGRADNIDRISLKLDRQNRPHLVYYDSGLGMLKYAARLDDGWHIERVDSSPQTGLHPSLCLDDPFYGVDPDAGEGVEQLGRPPRPRQHGNGNAHRRHTLIVLGVSFAGERVGPARAQNCSAVNRQSSTCRSGSPAFVPPALLPPWTAYTSDRSFSTPPRPSCSGTALSTCSSL